MKKILFLSLFSVIWAIACDNVLKTEGTEEDNNDSLETSRTIVGDWVKESYNWVGGSESGSDMDHEVIILREDGTGYWELDEDDYRAGRYQSDLRIVYKYDVETGDFAFHYYDDPSDRGHYKLELQDGKLIVHSYVEGHEWWVYKRVK